ncbi:MAG: hypothetical protein ACO1OD_04100 [Croceibacterium sp.]
MRRITCLAAVAALVAGGAAAAADKPHTVDGWQVGRGKQGGCMMTAMFDDRSEEGVSLSLVWDKAAGQLGFLASSRHWNGLRERAGDPTALELNFDGNVPYRQWVHEAASFHDLGGIEAVMGVWQAENSEDLARAVTGSRAVAVKVGETDLGTFNLSGAGPAYRELLRCGERG